MPLLYLKYLKASKSAGGFTLIELLIVIIIIGILSAIALPSFLNQANKARNAEAKLTLSSINKAQQAYFLENASFVTTTSELPKLGLGLETRTANFNYSLEPIAGTNGVAAIAKPNNNPALKGFIGAVGLVYQQNSSSLASISILCESTQVGAPAQALNASNIVLVTGTSEAGGGSIECGTTTVAAK